MSRLKNDTQREVPEDSIINVDTSGTARVRDPNGRAVDDEDPDYSPMDRSPARRKVRQRDETSSNDTHVPGADQIRGADADEDTYD